MKKKQRTKLKVWGYQLKDGSIDIMGDGAPNSDLYLIFNRFNQDVEAKDLSGKSIIDESLVKELIKRGYDISTLKFSIEKP